MPIEEILIGFILFYTIGLLLYDHFIEEYEDD